MRILFLSAWFPYPPDNGAKIRVYHLLCALSAEHDVHLITFLPTPEEAVFLPALRSVCRQVDVVERNPFRIDRGRAWLGHLSSRPSHVVAGRSAEMAELVARTAARERFDAMVASTTLMAQYTPAAPGPPRLLEEHNFMPRWMKEQYLAQSNPARRAMRWLTWRKGLCYERRLYSQFSACTLVSEQDCRAVREAMPAYRGRVEVVPNGVDLERNQRLVAEPQPDSLVFSGSLTYSANAEAMQGFVLDVLPRVRRHRPDVRLSITGRHDGVDVSWLVGDAAVTLTGYLEDVRPAIATSWACVVPIRSGGGTRLKILEAMALGTPVVATSKGAEGLDVTHDRDILIADSPSDLGDQIVRLLSSRELRAALAENGRRLVESRYDWRAIGRSFCRVVEETAASAGAAAC